VPPVDFGAKAGTGRKRRPSVPGPDGRSSRRASGPVARPEEGRDRVRRRGHQAKRRAGSQRARRQAGPRHGGPEREAGEHRVTNEPGAGGVFPAPTDAPAGVADHPRRAMVVQLLDHRAASQGAIAVNLAHGRCFIRDPRPNSPSPISFGESSSGAGSREFSLRQGNLAPRGPGPARGSRSFVHPLPRSRQTIRQLFVLRTTEFGGIPTKVGWGRAGASEVVPSKGLPVLETPRRALLQ
jgi:hypothetical protein